MQSDGHKATECALRATSMHSEPGSDAHREARAAGAPKDEGPLRVPTGSPHMPDRPDNALGCVFAGPELCRDPWTIARQTWGWPMNSLLTANQKVAASPASVHVHVAVRWWSATAWSELRQRARLGCIAGLDCVLTLREALAQTSCL